jgi:branched-chain amino acid transport system substrate-binding protein
MAFAAKYKQRFGKEIGSFALYGYVAADLGIKAIENAISELDGKKPTRKQVSAAVRKINYKGVTGSISLDHKGDPAKAKYFVLKFEKKQHPGTIAKVIEYAAPPAKKS